jgi:acyl CoA:acetate/3-ketoacid CoA transferase alpha subunit
VSVAVTVEFPEIASGALTEQVGASAASVGLPVTAQLSATIPRNPPPGVTVIVEVPLAPDEAIVTAVLLNVKLG